MIIIEKIVALFSAMLMMFNGLALGSNPVHPNDADNASVILLIGDGMGFNSIAKAKAESGVEALQMERFSLRGESKTRSANDTVTDSAAGGTALATGIRTNNDYVGVYSNDPKALGSYPMNLSEFAISLGKSAGVVTTDSTSGATPASFSSHSAARSNEADITSQQLNGDLTLLWGGATASFSAETAAENGFEVITNYSEFAALENGTRSFGQFTAPLWYTSETDMPQLYEMTEKAIDILDDDEDGFFLMVEGAHIDKNNHSNDGEGMKQALLSFDKAVGVALDYAAEHDNVLVVVTADHETGGITLKGDEYVYTKTGHTGVNVPLFVYGCNEFINGGDAIMNKCVADRMAMFMSDEEFPRQIKK